MQEGRNKFCIFIAASLACIPSCDCQVGSVLTACTLYLLMTGDEMINRYEEQFNFPEDLSQASQGIIFASNSKGVISSV